MLSPEHLIDFEILSAAEPNGSGPAFDLRGLDQAGIGSSPHSIISCVRRWTVNNTFCNYLFRDVWKWLRPLDFSELSSNELAEVTRPAADDAVARAWIHGRLQTPFDLIQRDPNAGTEDDSEDELGNDDEENEEDDRDDE